MTKFLILSGSNSAPTPKYFLGGFGYKGIVFCRNNGWLMKNMDKEPTVPKWLLINQPKIPKMSQNFSVICLPKPKSLGFAEKNLSGCLSFLWIRLKKVTTFQTQNWWILKFKLLFRFYLTFFLQNWSMKKCKESFNTVATRSNKKWWGFLDCMKKLLTWLPIFSGKKWLKFSHL